MTRSHDIDSSVSWTQSTRTSGIGTGSQVSHSCDSGTHGLDSCNIPNIDILLILCKITE